jgi:hypothetical protein
MSARGGAGLDLGPARRGGAGFGPSPMVVMALRILKYRKR